MSRPTIQHQCDIKDDEICITIADKRTPKGQDTGEIHGLTFIYNNIFGQEDCIEMSAVTAIALADEIKKLFRA